MFGYDPQFLGGDFYIPLPGFRESLTKNVLCSDDLPNTHFQNKYYTRYINYSICTSKLRKQPIVVALNINQDLIKPVPRREWNEDPQVGQYQLNNSYYLENVYDRGHLARRSAAAWGSTEDEARAASNSTMFYSNASLQHENFNQDEWLELEDWVKNLRSSSNNRVSVFSGPIYSRRDGTSKVIGNPPAEIPSAFFKVVCYIDEKGRQATRAFLMAQDSEALSDKNGKSRSFDLGAYQVPVTVIEDETGLVFDEQVKISDPLDPSETEGNSINGNSPIIAPITPLLLSKNSKDHLETEYIAGIGIACALVDAKGDERREEWVSIVNFSGQNLDLSGWMLSDSKRNPLKLYGSLRSGESRKIEKLYDARTNTGVILSNKKGTILLLNKEGKLVDRVIYSNRNHNIVEGVPVVFNISKKRETFSDRPLY